MTAGDSSDEFHDLPLRAGWIIVVCRHVTTEARRDRARDQPVSAPPGSRIVLRRRLTDCSVKGSKDVVAHRVANSLVAHTLSPSVCQ